MAIFRNILIIVLSLSITSCCANDAVTDKLREFNDGRDLNFKIKLDKSQYYTREPMTVQYTFTNTGSYELHLGPMLFGDIIFMMKCDQWQNGKILDMKGPFPYESNKVFEITTMDVGKSYSDVRTLDTTFYAMPQEPGHYKMYAIYWNPIKKGGKKNDADLWVGKVKSNVVEFDLVPSITQ